jgi:hypothetical protein
VCGGRKKKDKIEGRLKIKTEAGNGTKKKIERQRIRK